MPSTPVTTDLNAVRRAIYAEGSLPRRDGTSLPIVPHTPHPDDSDLLRDLAARCAPEMSIEIGCATGLSTIAIFEGLASAGVAGTHTAIDPYASHHFWGGAASLLLERAGIADRVTIDERESAIALPEWIAEERTCDFAFVDGCHWFECALIDLTLLARIVRPGGTVAVDDPWMPAVADAVAYATSNLNYEHAATHERNGKPRLVELRVTQIDADRRWDSYTPISPA